MGSFCHGRVRLAIDGGNADLVPGGGDSFFFSIPDGLFLSVRFWFKLGGREALFAIPDGCEL